MNRRPLFPCARVCCALGSRAEDPMAILTIEESRLKKVFKEALVEVLEEKSDLVRGILEEALEDASFIKAIQAGELTKPVSRAQVLLALGADR